MSDRVRAMIRRGGGSWQVPSVGTYGYEKDLQEMLMDSPDLIPGIERAAAVAEELPISGAGSLDLLVVEPNGDLTLVECKLAANAEVRRAVVGQIASYAAGLWQATFEDLDDAFQTRTGTSLVDALEPLVDDTWEAEQFRRTVADRLASGEFRLVIAVDSITEELKRIVEFLNAHTTTNVEILALEIGYVAEGDVEILLPVTHGSESVRMKGASQTSRRKWTVDDVLAALGDLCSDSVVEAVRDFGERIARYGGYWQPGGAVYPTMSAYVEVGPKMNKRSLLAVYADPSSSTAPRVTINFGSLLKDLSADQLEVVLSGLEQSGQLRGRLSHVREAEFNVYPPIPLSEFAEFDGPEALLAAVAPFLSRSG